MVYVGISPIAPMMLAFLIPIIYNLSKGKKEREKLRPIIMIVFCSMAIVVFYPLTSYLYTFAPIKYFGYSIGKFILFVLLPAATILYVEGWGLKKIFDSLGVRKKNIRKSIAYGMFATLITVTVTLAVMENYSFDFFNSTILFFESFTEEFFFRGFLFLYLLKKTDRDIAFATSTSAFVLAHPQHFTELFLISTVVQGILLAWVTDKTKNIIGPWISHGLNRFVPALLRNLIAF